MATGEQHLWDLSHPMVMDYLTWLEMCGNGVKTNMMCKAMPMIKVRAW